MSPRLDASMGIATQCPCSCPLWVTVAWGGRASTRAWALLPNAHARLDSFQLIPTHLNSSQLISAHLSSSQLISHSSQPFSTHLDASQLISTHLSSSQTLGGGSQIKKSFEVGLLTNSFFLKRFYLLGSLNLSREVLARTGPLC